MEFHHVGTVTADLDSLADRYAAIFGLELVHTESLEALRVGFLELDNGYLELLEPLDDEGPVARHLASDRPAMHHVALSVPDIDAALQRAVDAGVSPIDETPRPGAWGHDVAFLHPSDTGGVLVEFVAV